MFAVVMNVWKGLAPCLMLVCSFILVSDGASINNEETTDNLQTRRWLTKYGYVAQENPSETDPGRLINGTENLSPPVDFNLTAAIVKMQRNYGIPITGKVDNVTRKIMHTPRCSVKDPMDWLSVDVAPYVLSGTKWHKFHITYKITEYTPRLSQSEVRRIMHDAFQIWSDYTPLDFTEVTSGNADMLIAFPRWDHGDGTPFDGRWDPDRGTGLGLAHAFMPPRSERIAKKYGIDGDTHFDGDEQWTTGTHRGVDLLQVATHEFGHALGLGHTLVPGTIMYPAYMYKDKYCIHPDDLQGIQAMYGSRKSKNPLIPVCSLLPEKCHDSEYDAVLQFRGDTYFIQGIQYFRRQSHKVDGPILLTKMWTALPDKIDAGYERKDGYVFFFGGSKYWKYNGRQLEPGYPRYISTDFGLPSDLDAALPWQPTGKTYFFKGERYWRYDEELGRIDDGYPRPISVWKGVPNHVDAATQYIDDDSVYFFKGRRYYKYSEKALLVLPGYPKYTAEHWMDCPPQSPDEDDDDIYIPLQPQPTRLYYRSASSHSLPKGILMSICLTFFLCIFKITLE
ncbi:collagenase 3-like [Branchiostoma floridae x Branchiostoma japonicum]